MFSKQTRKSSNDSVKTLPNNNNNYNTNTTNNGNNSNINNSYIARKVNGTPRYTKTRKISTLNPNFVNTNNGILPTAPSNTFAIVSPDGTITTSNFESTTASLKEQLLDVSSSLSNNIRQQLSPNTWTKKPTNDSFYTVAEHKIIPSPSLPPPPPPAATTPLLKLNEPPADQITPLISPVSRVLSIPPRKIYKAPNRRISKPKRMKKHLTLMNSEKSLRSSKTWIYDSNTSQNMSTQTTYRTCKHCRESDHGAYRMRCCSSGEPIKSGSNRNPDYGCSRINCSMLHNIDYKDLKNSKQIIVLDNQKDLEDFQIGKIPRHEFINKIQIQPEDLASRVVSTIENNDGHYHNHQSENPSLSNISESRFDVDKSENYKTIKERVNPYSYNNKLLSIILFVALMYWFISVVFKMTWFQDAANFFYNYLASLPIFSMQKRRELTKVEIGLKYVSGFINFIKVIIFPNGLI